MFRAQAHVEPQCAQSFGTAEEDEDKSNPWPDVHARM
jgi:hypothetical protein